MLDRGAMDIIPYLCMEVMVGCGQGGRRCSHQDKKAVRGWGDLNRRQKEMGVRSEETGARASSGVGDSRHGGGAWWARARVQGKEEGGVLAPQTLQGSESTISLSA